MQQEPSQFEMALKNHELDHFVAGVHAQVDNEEPQNVRQAFDLQVYPTIRKTQDPSLPDQLADALIKMIHTHLDTNRALYLAYKWIWYCRYIEQKKAMDPTGFYVDLPVFDFSDVALLLQKQTAAHAASLKQDTRWAGAAWNSAAGLWEPIIKTAQNVRDKLSGPDCVPPGT